MKKTIVCCYNDKCLHLHPSGLCSRGVIQLSIMSMCDSFVVKVGKEAGLSPNKALNSDPAKRRAG